MRAASRARRPPDTPDLMTTFVFRVRNVPAALYKALGGFATNGVNMTKLESYMLDGQFTATQFLCDVDGHPEQPPLRRALEELSFFSREARVLGVYPTARFRQEQAAGSRRRGLGCLAGIDRIRLDPGVELGQRQLDADLRQRQRRGGARWPDAPTQSSPSRGRTRSRRSAVCSSMT